MRVWRICTIITGFEPYPLDILTSNACLSSENTNLKLHMYEKLISTSAQYIFSSFERQGVVRTQFSDLEETVLFLNHGSSACQSDTYAARGACAGVDAMSVPMTR